MASSLSDDTIGMTMMPTTMPALAALKKSHAVAEDALQLRRHPVHGEEAVDDRRNAREDLERGLEDASGRAAARTR